MRRRIAIKRLTASDLTVFEHHFRTIEAGNQKAINLNANVFIDQLYPNLAEAAEAADGRLPLDLFIYGPAGAGELNLQRKIIKWGTYKNWRLDGEYISNPDDSPERFNALAPGDLAVLEFEGHPVPVLARLVLLADAADGDRLVSAALKSLLGEQKMISSSSQELSSALEGLDLPEEHPARVMLVEDALEDAAQGGVQGQLILRAGRTARRIRPADLRRAKAEAELTGRLGEELIYAWLLARQKTGEIAGVVWEADANAIAPFDLSYTRDGSPVRVEVKSTAGDFRRRIHISRAELEVLAGADSPCHLYRVSEASPQGGTLRIAEAPGPVAAAILSGLDLPSGVTLDSVSVDPSLFAFGSEIFVTPPDD